MTRDELMQIGHDAGFDTSELTGEVIALLECVAEHAEAKERTARIEAQAENEALKSHPVGKTLSADYVALKAHQAGIAAVTPEITMFAELLTRSERTARIEAQQRIADAQEQIAKSDAKRENAVQRGKHEAMADELAACALVCRNLHPPESCTGAEKSLWDVATMACEEAILARYNE